MYLPADDLRECGVTAAEFGQPSLTPGLRVLLEFELRRALWALMEIYRRLLDRIARQGYPVLERRVSLPACEKVAIILRAWAGVF